MAALLVFGFSAAQAQTKNDKWTAEINALRSNLLKAVEKGDRRTLEEIYADDFTHTHAVGQVDGKAKRLDAILAGGTTLETVQPDEIKIRFYNKNTAIAVGQSRLEDTVYRWTVVYVKKKNGWQIAASQATKKTVE